MAHRWVPAWSVGTILNGVLSFMLEVRSVLIYTRFPATIPLTTSYLISTGYADSWVGREELRGEASPCSSLIRF
jgi:hypothetical protein